MDYPMEEEPYSGWRSPMNSDDMDTTESEEEMDQDDGETVSGLNNEQQKVLAVVKNNDTEEGADIASDFGHLHSKFQFSLKILTDRIIFHHFIYKYIQCPKTNYKIF